MEARSSTDGRYAVREAAPGGRTLKFGVTLPQVGRTWQEARTAARLFEDLGFDSLWVCDHLHGFPTPDVPILEAWTELTAVGALTNRIGLGTLISPVLFRNPAVLAKQVATLEQLASGRTILGLGAGWNEAEARAYGVRYRSMKDRLAAVGEAAEILRRLFRDDCVTFAGREFTLTEAYLQPKPVHPPPILIGGSGATTLEIAARHADIWNNPAFTQERLAANVSALQRSCAQVGRDFGDLQISQQCDVMIAQTEGEARQLLAEAQQRFGSPMAEHLPEHGLWGTPDRVTECIEKKLKLGCSHLMMEFLGPEPLVAARLFSEQTMAHFDPLSR